MYIDNAQMNIFQDIGTYIETCSNQIPTEPFTAEIWKDHVEELFEDIEDTEVHLIKDAFLELVPSFYQHAKERSELKDFQMRKNKLNRLINTVQIEQRSDEWYKQAQEYLTASQFSDILTNGRTRGKLVLSKVLKTDQEQQARKLASWTNEMTPFDWGIRFEPVAKMVYETITKTRVKDIGRVIHPNATLRLAASPDGIIEVGDERVGRLVEFKAPISRPILSGIIPKNYWHQMQIQMEVTDINICDYFEVQLRSKNKNEVQMEGPALYYGYVYVIGRNNPPYEDPQPYRYIYSEINQATPSNTLDLPAGDSILETLSWELMGFNLIAVPRSHTWFESIQPQLIQFWADVISARDGAFTLPESKRQTKYNICLIQEDPLSVDTKDEVMIGSGT